MLRAAAEHQLEGVVAKRRDSPYRAGRRSTEWVKVKNFRTQEVVLCGWTDGLGARAGSLGASCSSASTTRAGDLRYAGKVGTGFNARRSAPSCSARSARSSPGDRTLLRPPPAARRICASAAHFVRPDIVGEVRYAEWTRDGRLRHPTWRGLRPDKTPGEVVREPRERVETEVDGRALSLSNLDKVLYPATGFTKGEVLDYYARIAEVILPHLAPDRAGHVPPLPQRRRRSLLLREELALARS